MAYQKPGVEIEQVQVNNTPILTTPDLSAVVVGQSYYWQEMTEAEETYDSTATLDVSLSGINSVFHEVAADDFDMILVDLQDGGTRVPLVYNTDFTAATANNITTITLVSGLQAVAGQQVAGGTVWVGFRALNVAGRGFKTFTSFADVVSSYGTVTSWNVLAQGVKMAMDNSGAAINAYGMAASESADLTLALDALETKEIYAMSFLTQKIGSIASDVSTHITAMSAPTGKKERIGFVCNEIPFSGTDYEETSSEKAVTAEAIRVANSAIQDKRVFSTFPEIDYMSETRHISTLNPTWIAQSFSDTTGILLGTSPLLARFKVSKLYNGVYYAEGDLITAAAFVNLKAQVLTDGQLTLTADVPVPGYYHTATTVGQVIAKRPEAPLTNVPVGTFSHLIGSTDYFSEAHLNTMAEGGTYIMEEKAINTVSSRHQMSTDVRSVGERELSVTTALDFTAKFIRKALAPHIGREVVSPEFLTLVNSIIHGAGMYLKRRGYIADLQIVSIVQNATNPDSIDVEVSILVKYPVNYIRIKLLF